MKTGHIKITLEDVDTKNLAIFDIDTSNSTVHFDLDSFDPDKGSDLFGKRFVDIINMLGLREKFMAEIETN